MARSGITVTHLRLRVRKVLRMMTRLVQPKMKTLLDLLLMLHIKVLKKELKLRTAQELKVTKHPLRTAQELTVTKHRLRTAQELNQILETERRTLMYSFKGSRIFFFFLIVVPLTP